MLQKVEFWPTFLKMPPPHFMGIKALEGAPQTVVKRERFFLKLLGMEREDEKVREARRTRMKG